MNREFIKDNPLCDKVNFSDDVAVNGEFQRDRIIKDTRTLNQRESENNKIVKSLEEAVRLTGLEDGMTISFHHHFRGGDFIVNMVMDTLAKMGFKNLVVAASSLTSCHAPLIEHINNGVVGRIETSGMRGQLAEQVSRGLMDAPVIFRSHGGRARVIETGALHIDVAFLGAPSCDPYGNANGYSREKDNGIMCGSLGYAKCDAQYADKTIILTDNIVPFPNAPFGIPESDVDYIVKVDSIGDPQGIMSGATRFTSNPKELLIAQTACTAIESSGFFNDGLSIPMGSGGASLAVARFLKERMLAKNVRSSFALGGITGSIVDLYEEGLIKRILDVQSFDLKAAQSLRDNRYHQQISASYYASPHGEGTAVNQLDIVVLSALEVDCNFDVNVLTGADGVIRGAIGGHPDTAFGAAVSIVVVPLVRGRIPCVVKKVNNVVTPGNTVDVIVTERGIAVNPLRKDLIPGFKKAGLKVFDIEDLMKQAQELVGVPEPIKYKDNVVGVITYRDASVIDLIYEVDD